MIANVGSTDKMIRLILGIALSAWVFFGMGVGSTLSYIMLIASVVLIATALLNFCPLFKLLGISSRKQDA